MSESTYTQPGPAARFPLMPRGSLGLKLLLVCLLVLLMGVPLIFVSEMVRERENRASEVTSELSQLAGGSQLVGGPMLLVPYTKPERYTDNDGVARERMVEGNYVVFAQDGSADATLQSETDSRRGIYRAARYSAATHFTARFEPAAAMEGVDPRYMFDWSGAKIVMFVRDARAIRSAAELQISNGETAMLEPLSDIAVRRLEHGDAYGRFTPASNFQAFGALVPFEGAPEPFSVETDLTVGGAQWFGLAAFAQNTEASIRGDRSDAGSQGYFQSKSGMDLSQDGFAVSWEVPYIARGLDKGGDLANLDLGQLASRDMAVTFVSADDVYQGVKRAVEYAILFIGIVFLAVLIFEALSGKRAHPAQYILVGLAQSIFYLLLLSITELIGFNAAFAIAAFATVALLAYYAGASSGSLRVGLGAFVGLSVLYGVMYVLMTIEDFAFFSGSVIAFVVIAAAMIATSRINWYGASKRVAAAGEAASG